MKCEKCDRPATFHFANLVGDEPTEVHVCDQHAREYEEKLGLDSSVSPALIPIIWEPQLIDEDTYARLVHLLGQIVRSEGGVGVKLLDSGTYGVPVEEEVFA